MSLDQPKWKPTTGEVAIRLLSRTRIANGEYAGDFTTETNPTAAQVEKVIEQAVNIMRPRFGTMGESLEDQARAVTTLRAAYMVELGFFPEQVDSNISPYNALRMEFLEELKNWDIAAKGMAPNSQSQISSIKAGTEYPVVL